MKSIGRSKRGRIVGRGRRPGIAEYLAQFIGVGAEEQRIEVVAIHVGVGSCSGREVGWPRRSRVLWLEIHDDADLVRPDASVGGHAGGMRADQVVSGPWCLEPIPVSRCKDTLQIAAVCNDPGFVERHPPRDSIIERTGNGRGIVGEPVGGVRIQPPAAIFEVGREIPVEEGQDRLYV